MTTIQGVAAFFHGVKFHRYVRDALRKAGGRSDDANAGSRRSDQAPTASPPPKEPKAVVFLPCCGVDERLERTVQAVLSQDYPRYSVVFTFESSDDPAYLAVSGWTRNSPVVCRMVTAGRTSDCAQKIHNLLAALDAAPADAEVYVFLDSDAVPHRGWLASLIEPLEGEGVGAATGYRWYTATGGFASGIRSAWNAATVTLLDDERLNFCWGGSTAIRRETFDQLDIRRRWARALSDDYQVTRAIRGAGLRIVFVPQALLPTRERTTLRQFVSFATRQLVITRVCAPRVWRAGFLLCCNFMLGATATFVYSIGCALGWWGSMTGFVLGAAGWASIVALAAGKAIVRQSAVRRVLGPPDIGWRDFSWDVLGVSLAGMMHLGLLLASARTRRIVWRDTVYELVSADETRVLGRLNRKGDRAAVTPSLTWSPASEPYGR